MWTLHSLQPSPVLAVTNDRKGMTRSFDMLFVTLLKELPSTTPTASFIMSSRKANLLYSRQLFSPIKSLRCVWNESNI